MKSETAHSAKERPRALLFVGSRQGGEEEFRQRLGTCAARWLIASAPSEAEAQRLLKADPWAGLVLDRDSLGPDLPRVLEDLGKRRSGLCGFIWGSGDSDTEFTALQSQRSVLLCKEWPPELLDSTLQRGLLIARWLGQDALKRVLVHLKVLPVLPAIYQQVVAILQDPQGDLEAVAGLISRDPVMTAKLLHLANSAFFLRTDPVDSPMQAVMLLGSERVRGLVLATHVFSRLEGVAAAGLALEPEWSHAMEVAAFAGQIARAEGCTVQQAEVAFTAGLLHDVGRLLLAANLPEAYRRLLQEARGRPDVLAAEEMRVLGTSHADVGALQLAVWGLPLSVLEAAAWHHAPRNAQQTAFSTLTAVHAANALAREREIAATQAPQLRMEAAYLEDLGLLHRRNRWREACDLPVRPDEEGQMPSQKEHAASAP